MKNNWTAYDYATETDIYHVYPGCRPAYLRETVVPMAPNQSDYYRPSIQPQADLWAWALVDTPHNMPRKVRCWFLLNSVVDGVDVRRAPENNYSHDRLVDPLSIKAGEPSKPAVVRRADRHARRIINDRHKFHGRKPTRWQRIKAFVGIY